MSGKFADDAEVEEWFGDRLRALIQEANDRGFDINHTWVCRTTDDGPDYEVGFVELADEVFEDP